MTGKAMLLATQAQLADQRAVALEVLLLQVVQEAAAAADEHQQAAARVVVVLVLAQVLGEVVDARGEQRDLHLGGTRVVLALAEPLDELTFFFGRDGGHLRRGRLAGAPSTQLRPRAFAAYSASSARRSSSSASSPHQLAQPTLIVTPVSLTFSRKCSAALWAARASVSGSSARNSSPPSRPSWSSARRCSRSAWATAASTRSPSAWPWLSFTALKWSMST